MSETRSDRTQPCELCGVKEFTLVDQFDRRGDCLHTVVCRGCGLVSHESIPTDAELQSYYANEYRQDYHGEQTPSAHRVIRAWAVGQWLLRQLKDFVKPNDRICEVGAGIGCTVKAFELSGYNTTGIEPGAGFYRFGSGQLRAPLQQLSLYDVPPVPSYDFILLVHVIEHFSSPRQALTHLRSLMSPEARLYVECPNIAGAHAAPGKQFHFAHVYNFSPETLVWLAESCGLSVHACLSKRNDRVLRYLFERAERPTKVDTRGGYEKTMGALQRYSLLTYHLRPAYLIDRLYREFRFTSNHVAAKWRVEKLTRRCLTTAQ